MAAWPTIRDGADESRLSRATRTTARGRFRGIALHDGSLLVPAAPVFGTKFINAVEHVAQSAHREEIQDFGRRTYEGWVAGAAHADDPVTELRHIRQCVSDHDDGHAFIGQASQQPHDFPVGAFVQPAGHLIQQQHAWTVEYLAGQARAFLLPSAE